MPKAIADASTAARRASNVIAFPTPKPLKVIGADPGEIVALSMAMDAQALTLWLKLGRAFVQAGERA